MGRMVHSCAPHWELPLKAGNCPPWREDSLPATTNAGMQRPSPLASIGQLIPNLELSIGLAEATTATALHVSFSLTQSCLPHIFTAVSSKNICPKPSECSSLPLGLSRNPKFRHTANTHTAWSTLAPKALNVGRCPCLPLLHVPDTECSWVFTEWMNDEDREV